MITVRIEAAQTRGTAVLLAALMVVCAVASAEEQSKTDFDQKIDASRIAADLGSKTLQDISPVTMDLPQVAPPPNFLIAKNKAARAQDYGLSHFQTQFQQQSALAVNQLIRARSDKRYRAMPEVKRRPLDDGFSSVQDERQRILQNAGQLDTRDQSLKTESDYIRTNKPLLDERRLKLNADIAAWNRDCGASSHPNGLPPAQYRECMRRDSILRPIRNQFNLDNAALNSRIVSYNENYDQMKKDVSSASEWWETWGDKIDELIKKILAAFAEMAGSKTGDCTQEEHDQLQASVKNACEYPPLERCVEVKHDCDTLKALRDRFQGCADARKKIIDECYGGEGDDNHRAQLQGVLNGLSNCIAIIKNKCAGVGVSTPR